MFWARAATPTLRFVPLYAKGLTLASTATSVHDKEPTCALASLPVLDCR